MRLDDIWRQPHSYEARQYLAEKRHILFIYDYKTNLLFKAVLKGFSSDDK